MFSCKITAFRKLPDNWKNWMKSTGGCSHHLLSITQHTSSKLNTLIG